MTGHNRAQNHQITVTGLAFLLSCLSLGCHGGPHMFSRNEPAASRKDSDRDKFVNRKRTRPESEYLKDDWSERDERMARNGSKNKTSKPPASRPRTAEEYEQSLAQRRRVPATDSSRPSYDRSGSASKSTRPEVARVDSTRRPKSDSWDEELFNESRTLAKSNTRSGSGDRSALTAKSDSSSDPFKDMVASSTKPRNGSATSQKVSTVNYDDLEEDDELDDELDEDDDEFEEVKTFVAKNSATNSKPGTRSSVPTTSQKPVGNRKFLVDDVDLFEPSVAKNTKSQTRPQERIASNRIDEQRADLEQMANTKKTATNNSARKTIDSWRKELDEADAIDDAELAEFGSSNVSQSRTRNKPNKEAVQRVGGTSSPFGDFGTAEKSQGAVLNGDLLIDSTSLPGRYQRSKNESNGSGGRVRSNSATTIDIVPGPTQPRTRTSGQISLQSMTGPEGESSPLTTANFEQRFGESDLEQQNDDSTDGPNLIAASDSMTDSQTKNSVADPFGLSAGEDVTASAARGWKKLWLILGAIGSAILAGLGSNWMAGWTRRRQLVPVPVPVVRNESENGADA